MSGYDLWVDFNDLRPTVDPLTGHITTLAEFAERGFKPRVQAYCLIGDDEGLVARAIVRRVEANGIVELSVLLADLK